MTDPKTWRGNQGRRGIIPGSFQPGAIRWISVRVWFPLLSLATLVGVYVAIQVNPALRPHLRREDWLLEDLTAITYLLTALGIAAIWLCRRAMVTGHSWLLAALCLLFFLEEISYGQRILGFDVPVILGREADSLHDVLELMLVAVKLVWRQSVLSGVGLAAVYLIIFGTLAWVMRWHIGAYLAAARTSDSHFLTLIGMAYILVAQIVDIFMRAGGFPGVFEETAEFLGSVALALAAIASLRRAPASPKGDTRTEGSRPTER